MKAICLVNLVQREVAPWLLQKWMVVLWKTVSRLDDLAELHFYKKEIKSFWCNNKREMTTVFMRRTSEFSVRLKFSFIKWWKVWTLNGFVAERNCYISIAANFFIMKINIGLHILSLRYVEKLFSSLFWWYNGLIMFVRFLYFVAQRGISKPVQFLYYHDMLIQTHQYNRFC